MNPSVTQDPFILGPTKKTSAPDKKPIVEPNTQAATDPFLLGVGDNISSKKKVGGEPYGTATAPTESISESVSVSTEPTNPTSFLSKDIDESQNQWDAMINFRDMSNPDPITPTIPDSPEKKEEKKRQILSEPEQLKKYRQERIAAIQNDIADLKNNKLAKYIDFSMQQAGIPTTQTSYTEGAQPILDEIVAKEKYLEEFNNNVKNVAAYAVASKEDLSEVSDAKLKQIGEKYLSVVGDRSLKDDLEVLRTMDATGASRVDAERTGENINFRLYTNGANALARYYSDVAEDSFQKAQSQLAEINRLQNKQSEAKTQSEKDAYGVAINALMQDENVKTAIESERNAMTYAEKSRNAIDQFPQVKRRVMRQQLNDAYFNLLQQKQDAVDKIGGPTAGLAYKLGNWIFGDNASEEDAEDLAKAIGVSKEVAEDIIKTDIKGWFGSADEAGVRVPGMLTGIAQASDETLAKAVMGAKRFFNVDNVEAKNRILSDRIQDYNLKAQKAKLFEDGGKLNFNPFSVFNTMGAGIGQTAVYAAPSMLTGGLSSGLAASERVGKLMSLATTTGSGFVGSYEDGYKEAAKYTDDEEKRRSYATKIGLVNGLSETILEPAEVAKKVGFGAKNNKDAFDSFVKMYDKKGAGAAMAEGLKEFGKVVGTENLEELMALVGETKFKESDLGVVTPPGEFINNAIETAITTTLTTLPLGIGAGINGTRDQSGIIKQGLFEAGNEPELYKSKLKDLLDNGTINQDQYNNRAAVVNTMAQIVPTIKPTDINGNKLSYSQKSELAAQQFRILNNNRMLEDKNLVEAEKPLIEADTKDAIEQQTNILTGQPVEQMSDENPPSPEEDLQNDIRNDLINKIQTIETKNATVNFMKNQPEDAISFIQEQATGMTTSRDDADVPTYNETVNMFGQDIVDQAVSILPQDQKDMIIKSWDAKGLEIPAPLMQAIRSTNTTENENKSNQGGNPEAEQAIEEISNGIGEEGQEDVLSPLYTKTSEELAEMEREAKSKDRAALVEAMGQEWVDKFNLSTNEEKSAMEDALTDEQKKVFGGEGVLDVDNPEIINSIRQRVSVIETSEDASMLGAHAARALSDLANNRNDGESIAAMNAIVRKAAELGIPTSEVQQEAISALRSAVEDTDAAEIMKGYFGRASDLKNKKQKTKQESKDLPTKNESSEKPRARKKINTIEEAEEELKSLFGKTADKWKNNPEDVLRIAPRDANENNSLSEFAKNNSTADLISNARSFFEGNELIQRALNFIEPATKITDGIKYDRTASVNLEDNNIRGRAYGNGSFAVNPYSNNAEEYYRTAVHEMIHSVTLGALNKDSLFPDRINGILEQVRKEQGIEDNNDTAMAEFQKGNIPYGLTNSAELLSEVFSNQEFYDFLKTKEYKGATLLERVFNEIAEAIKRLFGIDTSTKNVADALMEITENYFKNAKNIKFTSDRAYESMKTPEDQVKDFINRSRGLDEVQLKSLIKKYTGWSDEKINGLFEEDKPRESGIKHAKTKETAKEFGFEEYEQDAPETISEWDKRAEEAIKAGYNIEKLISDIEGGKVPDKTEQRIMARYIAGLEATVEESPTKENTDELIRAVKASDIGGGREIARSLVARRGMGVRDNSLAGFFVKESEAKDGSTLTQAEMDVSKKEYEAIKEAQLKYEQKVVELEKENARLRAEKALKKEKTSKSQKKSHAEYVQERKNIVDDIRKKLKDARSGASGLTAVPVPYAKELIAIAPDVMKLTRSLLEEGVSKLSDIVSSIHSDLKDSIDGLTEKDIHDIIAGDYNQKRPTRSELTKQLAALRKEAKDQDKSPESKDKAAIAAAKSRLQSQIRELEGDLKMGNYQEPEAPITPIKLDKEALDLKDKLIKLRTQREIRLLRKQYENRTKRQKIKDRILEVLNVPRTIMSSMDYSAPLRQAIIPTISHPTLAAKAGLEMFKQSFSQKRFDRWFADIKQDPRYEIMQESGLYVADPHDPRLSAKEEAFMNNLAEKIPFIGKMIKASERAYVGYLNKMRVDLFNRLADGFEDQGITYINNPEVYSGLAKWINNATGRGGLGKIETAAPVLNSAFFSPRLIASRFNILGLSDVATFGNGLYGNMPKQIRIEAMKDLLKFIGTGTTLLSLLALGSGDDEDDIKVETDPRSTDFGKIRQGNTRWDIWGGFQQYVRLITQLATGEKKSATSGNISELSGEGKFGESRGDVVARFVRGKLAPVPSSAWNLLTGRNVVGEKVTPLSEAMQHLSPLIISDMKEALKDRGVSAFFTVGLPSIFGIGVQTFNPRGYENVNRKEGVYKTLFDKNLNLNIPDQKEGMTEKQYEKFVPAQQSIFQQQWQEVIDNGAMLNEDGNPTVDVNKGVALKPFDKLTHEELSTLMQSISSKATRQAEKEIGYQKPKEKKNQEYLNQ